MTSSPETYEPAVLQLDELAKALRKFVVEDESSSYPCPYQQERHRLPGFLLLADKLRPLRDNVAYKGWPASTSGMIKEIIGAFDEVVRAWGWEELLGTDHERTAYIETCDLRFKTEYLIPIQEAAKHCSGSFKAIDLPPIIEKICEEVPDPDFNLQWWGSRADELLIPVYEALQKKNKACRLGKRYPGRVDVSDGNIDFLEEKSAMAQLLRAVAKIAYQVNDAKDKLSKSQIALSQGSPDLKLTSHSHEPAVSQAPGQPAAPRQEEVIILVHGIRTHALWQSMVTRVLQEIPNTSVKPIKYGYFDSIRFWFPFLTRQHPINEIRREIQNARAENPNARFSIVAHSFGTYAISRILEEHPDIQLHRLILCGSIVSRKFRWDYVKGRLQSDVINDYGTRDIWPVLAGCLSWGYGDSGRHGFGRAALVKDRGHDFEHGDFFTEEFVREFWKPLFEDGTIATSTWDEKAKPSPWYLNVLSVIPGQWIIVVMLLALLFWFFFPRTLLPSSPATREGLNRESETSLQLPENIDFVDADFLAEENPDVRGTKLDVKFTNQASRTAFVKHLILDVKKVWHLRHPPIGAGAVVGPSAQYEVKLDETKVPYSAKVSVSHSIEPGKSDRFVVLVKDLKQWSGVYSVYRFSLELVADGSDNRKKYKSDFLVFFSEYANKFPSLEEALSQNQLQSIPVDDVRKLLDENRATLSEISKETNCVFSPALLRFIKSAEPR